MKTIKQTLVLLVFIFTATTVSASKEVVAKSGYITYAAITSSLPSVVVDKGLDGRIDSGHGDAVDKNYVKVWVNTSESTGFFAILDANEVGAIKNRARNAGYCPVSCSFSLYNDKPYGLEADPSSVTPGSCIGTKNESPILGYVTSMQ